MDTLPRRNTPSRKQAVADALAVIWAGTPKADVGLGQQRIEFFGSNAGSRLAERVAMTCGYRFDPAHEISASGGYANVAAPGQTSGSEYKWYTFSLRARVGF